ncbi:DUF724 domain-containing protein 1 isoform X2 [Ananas comosus]|uniref:DUF724 domain-containing protein 1 isoform X2 n=1 Tax=Ananas comosus TaxID=4615 RepID=A0A6P5EMY0_ANACO|nr:DUF724 domain-containing protein 1 isoform X2 [Ananas comosus]
MQLHQLFLSSSSVDSAVLADPFSKLMGRPARKASAGDSSGGGGSGGEGFPAGARVEVRSHDDGFRGAWYEATVAALRRRRRRHLRYVVSYSTLVSDADPSAPLTEAVASALVRPSPPSASASASFELHQLVEAFHNDGWWAGVVSAVRNPSSGRYAVSFPNSRELIEFPPSEIRPRMEWVRGEWVPAQDLQVGVPMFNAREKVEVSRYLDNFSFAWFPATIVKVIGTTNFIVEYENLRACGEEELLTEILDVQYIRPVPYIFPESKNFDLSADVEAFCNGGWSAGVVSKVLFGSKYVVKMTRHDIDVEMEFDCTQLRFRREWNGKQWIEYSSKGKNGKSTSVRGMPSKRRKQPRAARRSRLLTTLKTSSNDVSQVTHESHLTNTEMKRNKADECSNGGGVESVYSKKRLKKGNLERYKLRPRNCLSSSGDSKTLSDLEEKSHCAMRTPECFPSEGNHYELPASEKTPPIPNISMESKLEKMNGINKSLITRKSSSNQRCKGSANQSKVSDITQASTDHEAQLSLPIAAWRVKAKRKINFQSPEKRKKTPNATKAGSRPRALEKNLNHILRSKESGDPKHSGEAHDDQVAEKRRRIEDIRASKKDSEAHGVGSKVQFAQQVDDLEEGCTTPQKEYFSEGDGNQLILSPTPLQLSCCLPRLPGTGVENIFTFDAHVQNAGDEVPDGVLLSFSKDSVEEVCGPDKLPSARIVVADDRDASTCETPPENILVPFVKSSSIWESVETLEVFQRMPQQPHFLPLDQYSSEFREGMAIGLMVSFANVVASMSKLSCYDSLALFEEKLKSLGPLEANGFDVRFLRSRLKELIRIKNVQMDCERRKAALQEKIMEKGYDNNQLDGLIGALDGVISEVERNLIIFREKRDSLVTQRESNSLEISRLEMDARKAEEAYLAAQQHFNRALVEPW